MSLYKLKVAMMIVMCAHVSRSLRGRLAREGQTMPERRAHEPVPVAREHMSLTVHSQYHAGTESSQARPGGVATMDDYVRTCMCGAPGRESAARDRPIDMCSRPSALVCPRAEDGKCVCVFRQVFKTRGYSGRHHRTQDPCSSALPDRYRSTWAAPDGSLVARTRGVMAAEKHLQQPSPSVAKANPQRAAREPKGLGKWLRSHVQARKQASKVASLYNPDEKPQQSTDRWLDRWL